MKNTVLLIVILALVCAGWAWTLAASEKRADALTARAAAAEAENAKLKSEINRIADGLHQFCDTSKLCTVKEVAQ
jgi:Flp pilus assembly protein CpaB